MSLRLVEKFDMKFRDPSTYLLEKINLIIGLNNDLILTYIYKKRNELFTNLMLSEETGLTFEKLGIVSFDSAVDNYIDHNLCDLASLTLRCEMQALRNSKFCEESDIIVIYIEKEKLHFHRFLSVSERFGLEYNLIEERDSFSSIQEDSEYFNWIEKVERIMRNKNMQFKSELTLNYAN